MCPQIPLEAPLLSPNAEGPNIPQSVLRREGTIGQAIGETGGHLFSTAEQLEHQVKEQEAQAAVATASLNGIADSDKKLAALKVKYPTGYVTDDQGNYVNDPSTRQRRTTADEYKDWANDRFQADYLNLPSDLAQQAYQQKMGSYFSLEGNKADKEAQKFIFDSAHESIGQNVQSASNDLLSTPNLAKSYKYLSVIDAQIRDRAGEHINEPEWQNLLTAAKAELGKNFFGGLAVQVNSTVKTISAGLPNRSELIQQAIDLLNGKSSRRPAGGASWSEILKPEDKKSLLMHFTGLKDVAIAQDKSEWEELHKDVVANLSVGGNPQASIQMLATQGNKIFKTETERLKFADKMADILPAMAKGQWNKSPEFLLATPEKRQAMTQGLVDNTAEMAKSLLKSTYGSDVAGSPAYAKFIKEQATENQKYETEQRTDFPKSLIDHPNADRAFSDARALIPDDLAKIGDYEKPIQTMLSREDTAAKLTLGTEAPQRRKAALDSDLSKKWGDQLKNKDFNSDQTLFMIQGLQKTYKDQFPALIHQMVDDHNLTPDWEILSIQKDALPTTQMIEAIKGGETAKENFKEFLKGIPNGEKMFDAALGSKLQSYLISSETGKPGSFTAREREKVLSSVVKSTAALMWKQDTNAQSGNPEDYVERAYESLIGRNIHIGTVNQGGFLGVMSRPSFIQFSRVMNGEKGPVPVSTEQATQVTGRLGQLLTPSEINKMKVTVPDSARTQFMSENGRKMLDEDFHGQLKRTAQWRMSDDKKGFNLIYPDGVSGKLVSVFSGKDLQGHDAPVFKPIESLLDEAKKIPVKRPFNNSILGHGLFK